MYIWYFSLVPCGCCLLSIYPLPEHGVEAMVGCFFIAYIGYGSVSGAMTMLSVWLAFHDLRDVSIRIPTYSSRRVVWGHGKSVH